MFEETKSRNAVLQKELTEPLKDYLGFRHVFRHSYGYELDWLRLNPLFSGMANVWQKVKANLEKFLLDAAQTASHSFCPGCRDFVTFE